MSIAFSSVRSTSISELNKYDKTTIINIDGIDKEIRSRSSID
jgi:hypothetical protein